MEPRNFTNRCHCWISRVPDVQVLLSHFVHHVSRVFLLIFDIPFFCFGKKLSSGELHSIMKDIRPGDIILYADRHFPVWQLAVKAVGNSNYGHAGIYEGNGYVIEATTVYPYGSCVMRTDINTFLNGYKSVCVIRPPYGSDQLRNRSVDFAVSQLGKPYDYKLNFNDDDTMYCTELVAKTIKMSGIVMPVSVFCGCKFYIPDDFLKIEKVNIIYGKPVRFRTGMLQHIVFAACFSIPYFLLFIEVLSLKMSVLCGIGALLLYILAGWAQYTNISRKLSCEVAGVQNENPVFTGVQLIPNHRQG